MSGTVGGALQDVIQTVENLVDGVLNAVESLLGSVPFAVHAPASENFGMSGLLASAPGGLHTNSIGVTGLNHGAAASVGHVENASAGHALPFHDNTSVSVAFPVKGH